MGPQEPDPAEHLQAHKQTCKKFFFLFKAYSNLVCCLQFKCNVLNGIMKALLSAFVSGAGRGGSGRGEKPSVWVVGCWEDRGGPGVGAGGALHGQGLQESGAARRGVEGAAGSRG